MKLFTLSPAFSFVSAIAIGLSMIASPVLGAPAAYGMCQSGCNSVHVACIAAAGAALGPAALACNAALGVCMAACVAAGAGPIP